LNNLEQFWSSLVNQKNQRRLLKLTTNSGIIYFDDMYCVNCKVMKSRQLTSTDFSQSQRQISDVTFADNWRVLFTT